MADLDVARAAARRDQPSMAAIRDLEKAHAGVEDPSLGRGWIGHVEELDLALHDRWLDFGSDTSARSQPLGGTARSGYDGRLFGRHRRQSIASVDHEMNAQAERDTEHADRILDHRIGMPRQETRRCPERGQLERAEAAKLRQEGVSRLE
jgi:hypothetical protein